MAFPTQSTSSAYDTVVIDLGVASAAVDAEPLLAEPAGVRSSQRSGRLAVVLFATAVLVSASGIPTVRNLPIAAHIPIGSDARMMVVGATAVVVDLRNRRNEVAAYDLRSGQPRWRSTLDGSAADANMFLSSGTVVVETTQDGEDDQVEGFALGTGAPRWIEPASMVTPIPAGLLVFQQRLAGDETVQLIDPTTGARRWRTTLGADCDTYLASDTAQTMSSGLLEVCPDTKEIVALDLATGRGRAKVHSNLFPVPRPRRADSNLPPRGIPPLAIVYLGDITIVATPQRFPGQSLAAFRTSDLAPLWSGIIATNVSDLYTCGPDVCLDENGSTKALDRVTGVPVSPPAGSTIPVGTGDPVGVTGPVGASVSTTRFSSSDVGTDTLVVVPVGEQPNRNADVGLADYQTPAVEGEAIPLTGPGSGNTWIVVQDGSSIRPVQLLRHVGDESCSVISNYVACTTMVDQVTVWTLG